METISNALPDEFCIHINNHDYGLRQVRYPDDLPLLYKWMHAEHVIPQWQLNKPELELQILFEKMSIDDHQRLYLITLDDQPVGYTEVYECYRDRIARYYNAEKYDIGIHLLLGETHVVGRGHFRPTMLLLAEFIFSSNNHVKKIIIEPNEEVLVFPHSAERLGYKEEKKINLPEKVASLIFWPRDDFYLSPFYKGSYQEREMSN